MIRVALLSRWHVHADDYARQALENPNITIAAVWDEDPNRGKQWAEELNVPFFANLIDVLQMDTLDGVIVDTPTNMHKEIIVQAATYGKHIFTEKVLALTVEECDEILAAVEANHVCLMISLPRLIEPYYLYAQKVLNEGLLGKLTTIRCRLTHSGAVPSEDRPHGWLPEHFYEPEACGGGAFIDLGAHPIYLTNRLAGPAKAVTARFGRIFEHHQVDDNSVAIVEYQSGALGIIETGFASSSSPFLLEMHGTHGTLLLEDNTIRVRSTLLENKDWVIPQELPQRLPSPMEQWVNQIVNGEASSITKQDARELTVINAAAKQSHVARKKIECN